MSRQIKLLLRIITLIVVLLAVGMHLRVILIPAFSAYKFWLVVGAFAALFITG